MPARESKKPTQFRVGFLFGERFIADSKATRPIDQQACEADA
jgi:hypothetical protein